MPVRDIESFWPVRDDPPRVLCNRGANGIDGTVSSAFGAATAASGEHVVLLIGDVALAHDIGGLAAARRQSVALTIVLVNNGGGAIFDFLALADAPIAREAYTRHIATPVELDFAAAAALYGLSHRTVADGGQLREALAWAAGSQGSSLIEVVGDRGANVEAHAALWRAVASALKQPAAAAAPPA
jgi:2-succinyl-5-enolpyruvyl-6-hydroxy-3-cyclohexene-1-carboxylate synthase